MKKLFVLMMGALLVLSSCGSYNEAAGGYAGANIGSIVGSAIGGITGGRHGHEWGTLIGTVGGAVVGATAGKAVDQAQERKYEKRQAQRQQRYNDGTYDDGFNSRRHSGYFDESDQGGYVDDRIDFDNSSQGYPTDDQYSARDSQRSSFSPSGTMSYEQRPVLEIRNAVLKEGVKDQVLRAGEECRVVFEIRNLSDQPARNVRPFVEEVSGNRHIHISQNLVVNSIPARQGVRYTATIMADNRLKDGEAVIRIGVAQEQDQQAQVQVFHLPTSRR